MKNITPFSPKEYNQEIRKRVPFYDAIQQAVLDVVHTIQPNPRNWADLGCGTGDFIDKARSYFPNVCYMLADPSEEMLSMARERIGVDKYTRYIKDSSEAIVMEQDTCDVITAILSHHYLRPQNKAQVAKKCYKALRSGGVYVCVENTLPATKQGENVGMKRWQRFQEEQGGLVETGDRQGTMYFPVTTEEQIQILHQSGFQAVEPFWLTYMQAGFFCIK